MAGNFIGTNAAGSAALGNNGVGVFISSGQFSNLIGGTTAAARNVISGNAFFGIQIIGPGTSGNTGQGNFIGTNPAGTAAVPNPGGTLIGSGAAINTVADRTAQ